MHVHLPLFSVLIASFVTLGATVTKEAVVRTIAYIGADAALVRFGKKEIREHRTAMDRFLDD